MHSWNVYLAFIYICFVLHQHFSFACNLHGTDSGVCLYEGKDWNWRMINMPFCSGSVAYPVCVPRQQQLPASRLFPEGRWSNHTILKKDTWVQDTYTEFKKFRESIEKKYGPESDQTVNEYGEEPTYYPYEPVATRFHKSPDCQEAFKNYFCWVNFPRCDYKRDLTFPTCRSACENFFISCGYVKDLHRCGKSKWYNGYFPEPGPPYLRDYFPGQPFRQNKFSLKGNDLVVCTPSIQGSGSSLNRHSIGRLLISSMFTVSIMIFLFFLY